MHHVFMIRPPFTIGIQDENDELQVDEEDPGAERHLSMDHLIKCKAGQSS
jgi:hypothetical protein